MEGISLMHLYFRWETSKFVKVRNDSLFNFDRWNQISEEAYPEKGLRICI